MSAERNQDVCDAVESVLDDFDFLTARIKERLLDDIYSRLSDEVPE